MEPTQLLPAITAEGWDWKRKSGSPPPDPPLSCFNCKKGPETKF